MAIIFGKVMMKTRLQKFHHTSGGESGDVLMQRRHEAGGEEKPKWLRRDAELRRREEGAEEVLLRRSRRSYCGIPGSDGAERGCGDAGAARPRGNNTSESGDESTTSS
jgi:hypothetical protein